MPGHATAGDGDAPLPAPERAPAGSVVLQLHDPKGSLEGAPSLRISTVAGAPIRPVDDGTGVDPHAGDAVYSAAIAGWDGELATFEVTDGTTTWQATGKGDGGPWLWVRIHDRRTMQVGDQTSPGGSGGGGHHPGPEPGPGGGSGRISGGAVLAKGTEWFAMGVGWTLIGAAAAVGLGVGSGLWARRWSTRPAPVAGSAYVATRVSPARVPRSQLGAALEQLGARRLLAVGVVPMTPPPGCIVLPIEPGALPDEIYAAAGDIALHEGPPLVLLVADAAAMDRPAWVDPVERLLTLVAGRFPVLVLVDEDQGAGTS